MALLVVLSTGLVLAFLFLAWRDHVRQMSRQKSRIAELSTRLEERDTQLGSLAREKAQLEAKYLAKVRAGETRKENLETYRRKNQATRRGLKAELDKVVANGDKWVPHAREGPGRPGKLGKPKGAPGGGKRRPEVIHKRIHVVPPACRHCGQDLSQSWAHVAYTRVLTDLENLQWGDHPYKVLTLLHTMLVVYRRWCPACSKWVYPDCGPLGHLRYGLNFVTFVISKRMRSRMPFERVVAELVNQFGEGLTLSAPAIVGFFTRHEPLLRDLHAQLQKIVRLLDHVHVDETGLPVNGKNWWTWVICNEYFTWYLQRQSRGNQAIKEILDGFEGVIVSDCWGAYNKLDAEQQKCLAHFVTDFNEILVRLRKETEHAGKVLDAHAEAQGHLDAPPAPKPGRPKKVKALSPGVAAQLEAKKEANAKTIEQASRVKAFLKQSWEEGPYGWETPPARRIRKEDAVQAFLHLIESIWKEGVTCADLTRLLKRCQKRAGEMFTYLAHEGVEPDNNSAERDLRPMVVQRKISGTFKSPLVGEVTHLLKSLLETCQKNAKSFEDLHRRLLAGEAVDLAGYFFGSN